MRFGIFCIDWNLYNENSALAQFRYYRDLSSHHADKFVRNPQAKASSSVFRLYCFVSLRKRLEEFFDAVLANSNS
jgi:hypothetical protein